MGRPVSLPVFHFRLIEAAHKAYQLSTNDDARKYAKMLEIIADKWKEAMGIYTIQPMPVKQQSPIAQPIPAEPTDPNEGFTAEDFDISEPPPDQIL